MTATDTLHEVLAGFPTPGKDFVWFVDELLRSVQHGNSVEIAPQPDESGLFGLSYRYLDPPGTETHLPRFRLGIFRAMLARIAKLCSDETGEEFEPYGGRYTLHRSSYPGPVRLDIEFGNSQATGLFLRIVRTPVPVAHTNGAGSHLAPAEPAAG